MNNDGQRAMRNSSIQASSNYLMDATRALQINLQSLYLLQNPFVAANLGTREASEPVRTQLRPVQDPVAGEARLPSEGLKDTPQSTGSVKPSADCDEQFVSGKFNHADASIDYQLYIPPASLSNGSLLVMLHGCTQEATDFCTGTAMNTLARDAGYTVLYPNQNSSANPNRCWNWFVPAHQQRGAGEPALLAALTQNVCSQQGLNPARIFVAGLSAGGAMALILAEEFPDVYAGVGVHSGLATGLANSTPQALRAMAGGGTPAPLNPATVHRPTLVIHGEQDSTVHPQNAGVIVERCLDQYRQHNPGDELTCGIQEDSDGDHMAHRHEYRNHGGDLVCRHLQLGSVGHAWSGGDARGSHTAAGGVSASESLLSFFNECSGLH